MRTAAAFLSIVLASASLQAQGNDVVLQALKDELARSRALRIPGLDAPYFVEYSLEDADSLSVSATLGGLLGISHRPVRALEVNVRVGGYDFDNTNYVLSGLRLTGEQTQLPVENNYGAMRQALWLTTDGAFKSAEAAIGRKRSALKNVNLPGQLPDFSRAAAVRFSQPIERHPLDEAAWKERIVGLSRIFGAYPKIISSSAGFESIQATSYLVNTEGTEIRQPDSISYIVARAWAQAPDGMPLRDASVYVALEASDLPAEDELRQGFTQLAGNLEELTKAPQGDDYTGPVLFEPLAAAQLFAQVLGDNLKITRKPIPQPGRPVPYLPSELEGRAGSRILPEWMDVVDDPGQSSWRGHKLAGAYDFDDEGVKPVALTLVEKGVLKNFLLTRTPALKGFESSNGRARLHGSYGASSPDFSNLFIRATKTVSGAELKKKLIQMCQEQNKPFGILIRKLDYPSSASMEELRRIASAMAQSGGGARPVSLPILVYRVYPDGREELVRGLRFRGLSTRSFKDIAAASEDDTVFTFLDNTAPFAMIGGGSYISPSAVIAPGLLFDNVELERSQDELPKPPIVPPPPLTGG